MTDGGRQQRIDTAVLNAVLDLLQRSDLDSGAKVDAILETTLARRVNAIARRIRPALGEKVLGGPFAGMTYPGGAVEGCIVPKLLGSYEAELIPLIDRVAAGGYEAIVNVGCAEGYYAVGLALRCPGARLLAYDSSAGARERCMALAALNGVGERVEIGETLTTDDWARLDGSRVFVLCDIEGGEYALLDPVAAPALANFDLLVELHHSNGESTAAFAARFAETHTAEWIAPAARSPEDWPALAPLNPVDRNFALIERMEPTPWLFLASAARRAVISRRGTPADTV